MHFLQALIPHLLFNYSLTQTFLEPIFVKLFASNITRQYQRNYVTFLRPVFYYLETKELCQEVSKMPFSSMPKPPLINLKNIQSILCAKHHVRHHKYDSQLVAQQQEVEILRESLLQSSIDLCLCAASSHIVTAYCLFTLPCVYGISTCPSPCSSHTITLLPLSH